VNTIDLVPACEQDLETLTEICIRAFHTDIDHGGPAIGGPPGYDSIDHQRTMLRRAESYLKILVDGRTAGGLLVYETAAKEYYLCQFFLDPAYHRQGIGLRAIELLFDRYPQATMWRTDTPAWNTRTKPFYEKLGFATYREKDGLLDFEKPMM